MDIHTTNVQWNLSKTEPPWNKHMCLAYQGIQFIQNKFTKISYIGTLSKVWFMQDFCLFRVWFRQASLYIMISYIKTLSKVWFMQDFCLYRVWFRKASLYIMISYIGTLSKAWFMQDFCLYRVWFRQASLYSMISYLQYEGVLML